MKIIKRIPAYYVAEEVEDLGWVYKWCPEQVVLECGACGMRETFKRSSLISSLVTCLLRSWLRTSTFTLGATRIRRRKPEYLFDGGLER